MENKGLIFHVFSCSENINRGLLYRITDVLGNGVPNTNKVY